MAFPVYFFSFSKKLNSTKRPPLETGKIMQCEIKDTCDIINPVLVLDGISSNIEADYNYCYIKQWTRYYYVTRYVFKDGYWNLHLSVDTLATWKSYIGASYQYIERAASGGDGSIVDNLTIGKGIATVNNFKQYELFPYFGAGTYVISVQGAPHSASIATSGGTTYYALSSDAMRSFIYNLTDSTNTQYADISKEILKANLDPFQFLVDCHWYPFDIYSNRPDTYYVTEIPLGWFKIPLTGKACISTSKYSNTVSQITIPKHPQYSTASTQYLNNTKFHSVYIFLPGLGLQKLESDSLASASTIDVTILVDTFTGEAQYRIRTNLSTAPLYIMQASIGVSIPLSATYAATSQRGAGLVSSFVNTLSQVIFPSAATRRAVSIAQESENGALTELNKISTLANMMGNPTTLSCNYSGNMGSRAILDSYRQIQIYSLDIPVQLPAYSDVGYPVYAHKQIASMRGYIKTVDAHCEAPATDGELSEINTFLSGGFFYE